MKSIGRNDLCPCGSGRKYKRCCGAPKPFTPSPSPLKGFIPAVRMKGGIRSNPTGDGFIAIIHKWDNVECRGEPAEWRHPQVFPTEEGAMQYYKTSIRPALERFTTELATQTSGAKAFLRRLE